MQKSSLKLYVATFLFILSLTVSSFAEGEAQCPVVPPPPPPPPPSDGGRMVAGNDTPTTSSAGDGYQLLKGVWEFIALNTDLF